ncbi:MAG: carboxypeptidase-like regulatory domain-containing protein [Planctomycetota bacterium]|nr:carboxypeptidase-like regulatory domain-containing protein [Planctomycetota bacterium]
MAGFFLALLLGGVGSIQVRFPEPYHKGWVYTVRVLRDGVVQRERTVTGERGRVLLEGLPAGRYDVYATAVTPLGIQAITEVVRNVAAVPGGAAGVPDVTLELHLARAHEVRAPPGSSLWVNGIRRPRAKTLLLRPRTERVAATHPSLVSSPERAVHVRPDAFGVWHPLTFELEAGLTVRGRVFARDGRAVADARIVLFADGYPLARRALTDAQGRFELSGFRGDVISVQVRALGYAQALRRVRFLLGQQQADVGIRLTPGSAATVVAVDARGRPLYDAEAVLLPTWYELAADEPRLRAHYVPHRRKGGLSFRFSGLVPAREYRIVLTRPDGGAASTATFRAPGAGGTIALPDVTVPDGAAIHGIVTRPDGVAAGVHVVCSGPAGSRTRRTDRFGAYRFEGLDPGSHELWVRDEDERRLSVDVSGSVRRDLHLPAPDPARRISGVVLDEGGANALLAELRCAGRRALTDGEGRFVLSGLPPGRDRFRLDIMPRFDPRMPHPFLAHTLQAVPLGDTLRIHLRRPHSLRLRFALEAGVLRRATLLLEGPGGLRMRRRIPHGAEVFEIEGLAAGEYRVEVAAPGFAGTGGLKIEVPSPGGAPVDVPIRRGLSISGKVVRLDAFRTGPGGLLKNVERPPGTAWVALMMPGRLWRPSVAPVEADGSFVLTGLPPEPVLICAGSPGLTPAWAAVDLRRGSATNRTLTLYEPVWAEIRVLGPSREALERVQVRVTGRAGLDLLNLQTRARFLGVVADDWDVPDVVRALRPERRPGGRLRIGFLAPGSYSVDVSAPGYLPGRVQLAAVAPWEMAAVRQALPGKSLDFAVPVRLEAEPR